MELRKNLAAKFFPKMTEKSAVRKLNQWIENCPPLMRALVRTGYKSSSHYLTEAQKNKIFYFLGE